MSTTRLEEAFTYVFRQEKWQEKLLIAFLLSVFAFLLVPVVFLSGYFYRLTKHILETGEPRLPEWDDWAGDFSRGLRLIGAQVLMAMPLLILILAWVVSFLGFPLSISAMESGGSSEPLAPLMGVLFLVLHVGFMGLVSLLGVLLAFFLPPALMHVIAQDRFAAVLDFSGWWRVFRANWMEFVVATAVLVGLYAIIAYLSQFLFLVLCLVGSLVHGAVRLYLGLVAAYLYAMAYRHGQARLAETPPSSSEAP